MANHEIRPGSWGKVPRAKLRSDGRWVANGRYKNLDGAIVQRFRTGSTARKAEDSLLALFQEMAAQDETKRKLAEEKLATKRPHPTDVLFTHAVEDWITYIQAGGQDLRVSTAYEYARMARADILPENYSWPTSTSRLAPIFCTASLTADATMPRPNITVLSSPTS